MTADSFLDTNVLVYAVSGSKEETVKRERALKLLAEDFGTSAQVLQEFYVTVVRKIEIPLSPEKALEWIEQFNAFPCLAIDAALVKIAVETSERYRISYWDGAIISAAQIMGTNTVFSEDLNHLQQYGSVQVINPFSIS
ncbi:MAG: PIN domain-containing protein [Gammaproteobacteria bacterium]|nr:PIN domain-containing protein [Gammaproteobacteria bacterium]